MSFRGALNAVPVSVACWEIECCAPPPTVGLTATWRIGFDSQGDWMDPLLDFDHEWSVAPFPLPGFPRALCLSDGLVQACWRQPPEVLLSGRQWLRGQLFGTKHGGDGWSEFPRTTSRVIRVQVATNDLRWSAGPNGRGRRGIPVPRSTLLTDVQQSPRRFSPALLRDNTDFIGDEPVVNGVLIDLATRSDIIRDR